MRIKFFLFFVLFLLLYVGFNAYVIFRIGGLLGAKRSMLYALAVVATVSLPFALYIERILPSFLSKVLYMMSTLWMGILLFLLSLLLVYEVINPFYTVPYAGIILIILAVALSIVAIINARGFVVKEVEIPIKKLKKDVAIVHLSDIHLGSIRNSDFLKKIVEKTHELDPDIVMITGDMVDARARIDKGMFRAFDRLRAQVYFVAGNHEVYEQKDIIYEFFNDSKIQSLKNEVVEHEGIQIIGIEFSQDKEYLGNELAKLQLDQTKPAVLMLHVPEGMVHAKKVGVDLQLAGHTHSGQIFPFNFLVKLGFKHLNGLYDFGGMYLYVSPGTGTWGPYMRLGSRNEITLLKLRVKRAE